MIYKKFFLILALMNTLTLREEVKLLRSALIGVIGKDREGNYRTAFVREMLGDLKRKPTHTFTTPEAFLDEASKEYGFDK